MPEQAVFVVHMEASATVTPAAEVAADDTPDTDEPTEAEE